MRLELTIVVLLITGKCIHAQQSTPFLERTVSISFTAERMDIALRKIANQAGFSFSYSPSVIEANKQVTVSFDKKTVREILDYLFAGAVQYKVKSKHVILTKAKAISIKSNEQNVEGYVTDEVTGERLKDVSVYDPVTLTSAVTDSYGFFKMKIEKPSNELKLVVNKQNYSDTLLTIAPDNRRLLSIPIRFNKKKLATVADSVGSKLKKFWRSAFVNPHRPNLVNIQDTIYRKFQFSFVPFVGTNNLLSGNVVNDYSLNLLGGYSHSLNKLEFGGLFNIERSDVNGVQAAGLFNVVGGEVKAAQFAGLFNANYGSKRGAQFAGLTNINWNGSSDFSAAGLMNFTRLNSSGVHLAGLANITIGKQRGVNLAGLFNLATQDAGPLQLAGLFNFTARNSLGAQIGGLLNFTAKEMDGEQVAGLMNITGGVIRGSQVAMLLNYGTHVKGAQLGLVNVSDSIHGVPVGFFSFVLKGYHKLEVSADEVFYTNVAFRTGVRQFYNIVTAGAKPRTFNGDQTYWTFGYGIGTAPKISEKLSLNFDLTANQIVDRSELEEINLLNKLYLGVDFQTSKFFSLTVGFTLNGYITNATYDGYSPLFTDYKPAILYNETYSNDINMKMWLGAKIGVRFF